MIYVLRSQVSEGATELARMLGGRKLRKADDGRLYLKPRGVGRRYVELLGRDAVVCWGTAQGPLGRTRILNGHILRSKFQDAIRLQQAGVPTIAVSPTRPAAQVRPAAIDPAIAAFTRCKEMADEFSNLNFTGGRPAPFVQGVGELHTALGGLFTQLRTPPPVTPPPAPVGEWFGRMNDHVGGNDLLGAIGNPDYWVRKLDIVKEYRVHSFLGRSIRAGKKAPREGYTPGGIPTLHPWVRSWNGGWRILYDGVSSKTRHRELAHRAVAALGLSFGAVDIGELRDKSLVVLEVNRAPGLDGGTVDVYANAINQWVEGNWEARRAA